jgi:hypothetical protein
MTPLIQAERRTISTPYIVILILCIPSPSTCTYFFALVRTSFAAFESHMTFAGQRKGAPNKQLYIRDSGKLARQAWLNLYR